MLIFILGRGLGRVFEQTSLLGFSTEQIDIVFNLVNKTVKNYELKVSFPTMDKAFWLKLLNLRIANDPPESEIISVKLICYFVPPRSVQRGLYSLTKPEPESLLLTVGKIKRSVGEGNVGIPILIEQRRSKAFALDPDKLPAGKDRKHYIEPSPILALNYFEPPFKAQTTVCDSKLIYLKTQYFSGSVVECGGVWKESSQWWNRLFWQTFFWDVELDNGSIYRLSKKGNEWFVVGEYD